MEASEKSSVIRRGAGEEVANFRCSIARCSRVTDCVWGKKMRVEIGEKESEGSPASESALTAT